jgi:hypothetical protein
MKDSTLAIVVVGTIGLSLMGLMGNSCDEDNDKTSDKKQQEQQEKLLQEGTSQVGMPAIKNFRERKLMKDIIEMRDQEGLTTYTYIWSDFKGTWVFFCNSVGYGIPYATQFTNPQKFVRDEIHYGVILPQADPNGLFSPSSADGTWVMCKDPKGNVVKPVLVEPRAIVSPFELPSPVDHLDVKIAK